MPDVRAVEQLSPENTPADPHVPIRTRGRKGLPAFLTGRYPTILALLLLAYALFDHAFAWLHIPGTPIFIGEVVLALGIAALLPHVHRLRLLVRDSPALLAVAVFMIWGFFRTVPYLGEFGTAAVRDAALWYYAIFAFIVALMITLERTVLARWAIDYTKVIPFLLLWFPFASILGFLYGARPPLVPDSPVGLLAHRNGNIAVHTVMAVAFLWLVPMASGRRRQRLLLFATVIGGFIVLLTGIQTRGGMLAAATGLTLAMLFMARKRGRFALVLIGPLLIIMSVALVADVRVPLLKASREFSVQQLADNITSLINPSAAGRGNVETARWRLELWERAIDDVGTNAPLSGLGFGENLGARYGVETDPDFPLRNPHNSHVNVLTRMGWIGVVLWLAMWATWFTTLWRARHGATAIGDQRVRGLISWLLIAVTMILINAVFDPTLEGPQVAIWLWTLVGVGVAVSLRLPRQASGGLASSRRPASSG